ncbi:MAG: hypothetical protein EOP38_24400 [Rubrivivax sp.]|nr:MAG: hypothetical protein EOP38_24400 [Rubrivivax sp.]
MAKQVVSLSSFPFEGTTYPAGALITFLDADKADWLRGRFLVSDSTTDIAAAIAASARTFKHVNRNAPGGAAGGVNPRRTACIVGTVGHSKTNMGFGPASGGYNGLAGDPGYTSNGWPAHLIWFSKALITFRNYAVSGSSSAAMPGQLRALLAEGPMDVLSVYNGGVNETRDYQETIADIFLTVRMAVEAGVPRIAVWTEDPSEGYLEGSATRISNVNAAIRTLPLIYGDRVRVVDIARIGSNPGDVYGSAYAGVLADLTYDITHGNMTMASLGGRLFARVGFDWFAPFAFATNRGDVGNLLTNGRMGGRVTASPGLTNAQQYSAGPTDWITRRGGAGVTYRVTKQRTMPIRYDVVNAGVAVEASLRVKPAIRNGLHYIALTDGTFTTAPPTGGTPFKPMAADAGGVVWMPVPENDLLAYPDPDELTVFDFFTNTTGATDFVETYTDIPIAKFSSRQGVRAGTLCHAMDSAIGCPVARLMFLGLDNTTVLRNAWGMAPQVILNASTSPYMLPMSREGGLLLTPAFDVPESVGLVRLSVRLFGMGGGPVHVTDDLENGKIPCRMGLSQGFVFEGNA